MKTETTNRLSCERARAFPIERALAKLGHFPARSNEKEVWFLSPLRPETQASFKVSKKRNRWYDHGEGKGGNVIDLICLITKGTVKEALKIIEQEGTSFLFQQQTIFKREEQDRIWVKEVKELTHYALKEYLRSRNISIPTANKCIKEVHYVFKNKNYFAIGFKNNSGGWELRNKYYKNCSSPKDVTHIENGNSKLIIMEGMFDLLSILSYYEILEAEYDFLVMNSTAFISKASEIMKGYLQIELYLDNDTNGQRTAEKLIKHSKNCQDRSALYSGFKDMNQWLIHRAKNGLGQEARDVSLLPQKQTRFTPGGRKE
jgi:5S rRNA maturation endonuclease (ribonuclease M5)